MVPVPVPGEPMPSLTSGTRRTCGAQIHMQAKHSLIKSNNNFDKRPKNKTEISQYAGILYLLEVN